MCQHFQMSERHTLVVLPPPPHGLYLLLGWPGVLSELRWNLGELTLAKDPVHCVGQLSSMGIHYLLASGMPDDYVWPLIQEIMPFCVKLGFLRFVRNDRSHWLPLYAPKIYEPISECLEERRSNLEILEAESNPGSASGMSGSGSQDMGDKL